MNTTQKRCYILNRVKILNKALSRLHRRFATLQGRPRSLCTHESLIIIAFKSLPLEGKVGGGLRRSDEVANFYRSNLIKSDLNFSTSSPSYDGASPQGEALIGLC